MYAFRPEESCSSLCALDLSGAGPAMYPICLPEPAPQPPEERQAVCQHVREEPLHQ